MLIAFWIITPILVYLFMIGISWKPLQMAVIKDCPSCQLKDGRWQHHGPLGMHFRSGWNDSEMMHSCAPWLSVVWPLILPIFAGRMVASHKTTQAQRMLEKSNIDKLRRQNELEEQKHQVELAKYRSRENEFLDQHLKLEEIRGRIQDR